MNEKRAIAICHTPLQVMNALNLMYGCDDINIKKSVLYIYHEFNNSELYSKRIKEMGLFQEVIDINPFKEYSGIIHKLVSLKRYLFAKTTLNHYEQDKKSNLNEKFDFIIFSIHSQFVSMVKLLHPNTEAILMDDGIGSYFGNILEDNPSKLFKFFNKYFFQERLSFEPIALYLNEKRICKSTVKCEVKSLDKISKNSILFNDLKKIFEYKEKPDLCDHRAIVLDQPIEEMSNVNMKKYDLVWKRINESKYRDEFLVRPHPRQHNKQYSITTEKECNLWELECISNIRDSHVLIGIFSTAQFMPLIMNGTEPNIIFIYKIILQSEENRIWKIADRMVEELVGMYNAPMKIYVPCNETELKGILDKLDL